MCAESVVVRQGSAVWGSRGLCMPLAGRLLAGVGGLRGSREAGQCWAGRDLPPVAAGRDVGETCPLLLERCIVLAAILGADDGSSGVRGAVLSGLWLTRDRRTVGGACLGSTPVHLTCLVCDGVQEGSRPRM